MRKLLLFLAIAFLFQSCFSYRSSGLSPDQMVAGRKYKIQRNNKYEKIEIREMTDSTAIVELKRGKQKSIPLSEITTVKNRKFSIVKTLGLPVGIAAAVTGLFILTYDGPSLGPINMFN